MDVEAPRDWPLRSPPSPQMNPRGPQEGGFPGIHWHRARAPGISSRHVQGRVPSSGGPDPPPPPTGLLLPRPCSPSSTGAFLPRSLGTGHPVSVLPGRIYSGTQLKTQPNRGGEKGPAPTVPSSSQGAAGHPSARQGHRCRS